MTFGMEKLEWCDYSTVKKTEDMFIRFDKIHERDRHRRTNRQTLHDGIGRACVASRGKNGMITREWESMTMLLYLKIPI